MHDSLFVRTACDVALLIPGTPWAMLWYMLPVMCFTHDVCSCCPVMHTRLPAVQLPAFESAAFALGVLGMPPCNATFLC